MNNKGWTMNPSQSGPNWQNRVYTLQYRIVNILDNGGPRKEAQRLWEIAAAYLQLLPEEPVSDGGALYVFAVQAWLEAELNAPGRSFQENRRAYNNALELALALAKPRGLPARVRNGLATVLMREGQYSLACETLKTVPAELRDALGDSPVWAEAKFRLALAYWCFGNSTEAHRALAGVTEGPLTSKKLTRHHLEAVCFQLYLTPSKTLGRKIMVAARRSGLNRTPEYRRLLMLRHGGSVLYEQMLRRRIRKMKI